MAIHILSDGTAAVSPNYLYSSHGSVSHPLQRLGTLPFHIGPTGEIPTHATNGGHPFFGQTKPVFVIGHAM